MSDLACKCCGKPATNFLRTPLATCDFCAAHCRAPGPVDTNWYHATILDARDAATSLDLAKRLAASEALVKEMDTELRIEKTYRHETIERLTAQYHEALTALDNALAERDARIKFLAESWERAEHSLDVTLSNLRAALLKAQKLDATITERDKHISACDLLITNLLAESPSRNRAAAEEMRKALRELKETCEEADRLPFPLVPRYLLLVIDNALKEKP